MRTSEVLGRTIGTMVVAAMLTACAAPRDLSSPEAALAEIFAALHEHDLAEACTYADERTFRSHPGGCEESLAYATIDYVEAMGGVDIDGSMTVYNDDGTAFVPDDALAWPEEVDIGRNEGTWFIKRGDDWLLMPAPAPPE